MAPPQTLLTGGSGFIGRHVLEALLAAGHNVTTTVRSQEKASQIKTSLTNKDAKLDFAIVEDIAAEGAFDEAVKHNPPFDYVIHTASPFHFNVTDTKKDLLDPAINGTTGILKAIKKSAPSVKRVVITSSFAAITNAAGVPAGYKYSEKDWNPVTAEQAEENPQTGYRASKTFAEKAAWEFVEKEKPNFDLATVNPPLVFGPVNNHLKSLKDLNTSNEIFRDLIAGKMKDQAPPQRIIFWVDVRDLAEAHVKAATVPEAGGKRFFVIAGEYSNKSIIETIKDNFPEYKDKLPTKGVDEAVPPKDGPSYDNSRSKEILGLNYKPIDKCVVDIVNSIKDIPA